MGVDFFNCDDCGETLADCGGFVRCDSCGRRFCEATSYSPECGNLKFDEESTCNFCRREVVDTNQLLQFLLLKTGLSRADATQQYQETAPFAVNVYYWNVLRSSEIVVSLDNGTEITVNCLGLLELVNLNEEELKNCNISANGKSIQWKSVALEGCGHILAEISLDRLIELKEEDCI